MDTGIECRTTLSTVCNFSGSNYTQRVKYELYFDFKEESWKNDPLISEQLKKILIKKIISRNNFYFLKNTS